MLAYGLTNVGLVRDVNEDSLLFGNFPDGTVFAVVCDGMGGESGGEIASRLVTETVTENLKSGFRESMQPPQLKNLIVSSLNLANIKTHELALAHPEYAGMGTTAVIALVKDGVLCLLHVGDSRAYLLKNNEISRLTRDHSIVQELIEKGMLSPEEAREHPKRHVITRAVGAAAEVEGDYAEIYLTGGESVLLCTDGLTTTLTDTQIAALCQNTPPAEAVLKLVDAANRAGGPDNISCVILSND